MLIMDSVYSQSLISLGFDPQTFPVIHKQSASSWGSGGLFGDRFAQAPIGLWDNYRGYSNVGKTPAAVVGSLVGSDVNASNVDTLDTGIKSSIANQVNINVNESEASLNTTDTTVSISSSNYETNLNNVTNSSLSVASSQYATSLQNDVKSIDVKVVNKELVKGFEASVASEKTNEYTVSIV